MLTVDYTEITTNIKEEYIKKDVFHEELNILERHIELPRSPHTCPYCHNVTNTIKDYYMRTLRLGIEVLVKYGPCRVLGKYRQRRYQCNHCGKTFNEKNNFVTTHFQCSKKVLNELLFNLDQNKTFTDIAKSLGLSITTVIRYHDKTIGYGRPNTLPTVLAIDEFRGNAGGKKFQVILTDPQNSLVLDILSDRDGELIRKYFAAFTKKERSKVKYLVMDMSAFFRSKLAPLFPHATIIADRFHVVRNVGWGLEGVRKREQKRLRAMGKYLKKSRSLLRIPFKKLRDEEKDQVATILNMSDDLQKAYALKYTFEKMFEAKGRQAIERTLSDFLQLVKVSDLPEFNNLLTSFKSWRNEVVNAFMLPYSNGFTEGCNNKIKVLKRISYGVRRFDRFRARLLRILPSIYNRPAPTGAQGPCKSYNSLKAA